MQKTSFGVGTITLPAGEVTVFTLAGFLQDSDGYAAKCDPLYGFARSSLNEASGKRVIVDACDAREIDLTYMQLLLSIVSVASDVVFCGLAADVRNVLTKMCKELADEQFVGDRAKAEAYYGPEPLIIELRGDVKQETLLERLEDFTQEVTGFTRVIIDFTDADHIHNDAIGILLTLLSNCRHACVPLVLVNIHDHVREKFEQLGHVERVFLCAATRDEALTMDVP